MRKKLGILIATFICAISQMMPSFAVEANNVLVSSMLTNSSEKKEIEMLAPEIVEYANLFETDGIFVGESDISFSEAYCVYSDVDVFEDTSLTKEKIEILKNEAKKSMVGSDSP